MSNKLPNNLINHLKDDPHFNYEAFIVAQDKSEKATFVQLNPLKKINKEDFSIDKSIPCGENGFFLKEKPVFALDPLFYAGCYYLQKASSMFLSHVIKELKLDQDDIKALDLCAASGGKSTLINSVLSKGSLLVTNEINKLRENILQENLMKWGNPNVVITNNDPSAFSRLPGYFDLVVIDAPCSDSGMFHKDHNAMDESSLANVKLFRERQQRIVATALPSLKTNGYLFYSTCSYSSDENEDMLNWMIEEFGLESVEVSIDENWGVEVSRSNGKSAFGYRFGAQCIGGERVFFAILKKKETQSTFSMKHVKMGKNLAVQQIAKAWITMDGLCAYEYDDILYVFPKKYEQDLIALQNVLYLKSAGTEIGKLKGKDLVPSHDLALSTMIIEDIQAIDLNLDDALSYLRREALDPVTNVQNLKGWSLIRYKNVNLGWVKITSNRILNYYPKELRLLK